MNRLAGAARAIDQIACTTTTMTCPLCREAYQTQATHITHNILANGSPVIQEGDYGRISNCCGSGVWVAEAGANGVLANNNSVMREGDRLAFNSGTGRIATGSPNVLIGNLGGAPTLARTKKFRVLDASGEPLPFQPLNIRIGETTMRIITNREGVAIVDLLENEDADAEHTYATKM